MRSVIASRGNTGVWGIGATLLVGVVLALMLALAARADAFVYWANQQDGTIGLAGITGTDPIQSFITGADVPCGVAVDDNFVYWANSEFPGSIARAELDGSDVDQNFITGTSNPCGVAVDENSIYWANQGGSTIGRASIDGTNVNQGFIGANVPNAVAVEDEFVYWTNFDTNTIGRANLAGVGVDQSFVSGPAVNTPTGVVADEDFVYWTNAGGQTIGADTIGRATINGSSPATFVTGLTQPCGVDVDDNFVYWANQENDTIGRAEIDGSDPNENFIPTDADMLCGVAVNADFPLADVSPSSIDFGGVLVGDGAPAEIVTLTNSSSTSVPLTVEGVSITGDSDFEIDTSASNCEDQILAPGATCAVAVEFSPSSLGGKSAALQIATDEPGGTDVVVLSGAGTDPELSISPTSIDFGGRLVGTTTSPRTVTLTNDGSAPDDIGQATIAGANANQFSIVSDDCSNQELAISTSCEITVDFSPTSTGGKQASLSIPSDDPTSPATVALSGAGTAPELSVSPASVQFGSQVVGGHTSTRTITVENAPGATGALLLAGVSIVGVDAGQFDPVSDGCSDETIQPGQDCQIGLRFAPSETGAASARVQIASNGSPDPFAVPLAGTGTPPPPNPPPSNLFTLEGTNKNKRKGTATLTVQVPGPGTVELDGNQVKSASDETIDAGEVTLLVKSTGGAKKKLKRKGKAKVAFDVTFTPTGGDPNTQTDALKLVKKKRR